MNIRNKKGEFSFVWLFAVIAGTAVLMLAIMGAIRYGKTASVLQDTEIAKGLSVVTDSLQAGFASGRKSMIRFNKETILENFCFESSAPDYFGFNELSVLTKERPNKDFEIGGIPIKVSNKYLFVSNVPGKEFYVFSVPITFAFRISDAIIIDSQEYCFIGLEEQEEIARSFSILGNKAKIGFENCTEDSIKVCFDSGGDCDIKVVPSCNALICDGLFEVGRVEHEDYSVDYVGNLLYPAIFSEKENYLCNVKRILYKQSILANLYTQKIAYMSARTCDSDLALELSDLEGVSIDLDSNFIGNDLFEMYFLAKDIQRKEGGAQCSLWSNGA